METKDVVTLAIALLGAVLGVPNTWQRWKQRRVRLTITPDEAVPVTGLPHKHATLKILNLSSFPVTIENAGFILRDGGRHFLKETTRKREVVGRYHYFDREDPPQQLQPRASLHVVVTDHDVSELKGLSIKKSFATTACGTTKYGKSLALLPTTPLL